MATNDIKERIYPDLREPSAPPDEIQIYRLNTIKEIEAFLNTEIAERSRLEKKFKNCSSVTSYINYGLTATTIISGSGGIVSVATGIGIPISLGLGTISLVSSLTSGIVHKLSKIYYIKMTEHHDIAATAQTILDGIAILITKAIRDASINHEEFQQIVTEKQRYLTRKQELRSKSKKALIEIYAKQRQELLEQGRREGREEVAKKLVNNLDTPPAGAI